MINIKFKMKITIAVIALLVLLSVSAFRTKNTMHSKVKFATREWCSDSLHNTWSSYCHDCEMYVPDDVDVCIASAGNCFGYSESWDLC